MKLKKALVFDDNDMILDVMTEVLVLNQFEVTALPSPTSFIEQQDKHCCHRECEPCFDVLITDNKMPGMTGLELLEGLKDCGCKLPAKRKAIISGDWSRDDLLRAEIGGWKVFDKPIQMNQLFQWLKNINSD